MLRTSPSAVAAFGVLPIMPRVTTVSVLRSRRVRSGLILLLKKERFVHWGWRQNCKNRIRELILTIMMLITPVFNNGLLKFVEADLRIYSREKVG